MNYLLNFSIILLVLWAFYKLILENTSWHQFKRAYLVLMPLIAAIIPFIVVRSIIVPVALMEQQSIPEFQLNTRAFSDSDTLWDWTFILSAVYAVGVLVMSIRFLKNIYELRIKSSDKLEEYHNYILVLRKAVDVPHSFFNKIYASVTNFKNNSIPEVVLKHEKAHLDQQHSWDILWIELLIIALWFHPLVYLLKFSIKLNHEFLADNAVINSGENTQDYQKTLLAYSAGSQHRTIANTFNFPIIKKRFTIMNTNTTKTNGILRSLAVIPLLTILVISCGKEEVVEEPQSTEIIEVVEETQKSDLEEQRANLEEQAMIIEVIENLTPQDIEEYNRLALKHKNYIAEHGAPIVWENETAHMQTIWNSMSPEQRIAAEPWPFTESFSNAEIKDGQIPPPPPPVMGAIDYIKSHKSELNYYFGTDKISAERAIIIIEKFGQNGVEISPDKDGVNSIKISKTKGNRDFRPPPPPPAKN